MFSGIVEKLGIVKTLSSNGQCWHFGIHVKNIFEDLKIGDSIAVNGVCLTVTHVEAETFFVTAVPETLRVTNLNRLRRGDSVNLERAVKPETRIGGHFVQGHVDGIGEISSLAQQGEAWLVSFSMPKSLAKYLVNKGFITIDGMSITIIETWAKSFSVAFIPYTIQHTVVQFYRRGTKVNLEVDILAKYVEKFLEARR